MYRSRFALAFAAMALAACQQAETPEQASARMQAESDSAKAAIDAINVRYAAFMNGNMADSVVALFTEGGVMMPPNMPMVSGHDAIRNWLSANAMPPGGTLSFTATSVSANGPIAIERGTYTFSMPAQGRTPAVSMNGKYLTHWLKVGGQWMIAAEIWSDDAAAGGN